MREGTSMETGQKAWHHPGFIVLLGVVGVSFSPIFVKFSTAPSIVLAFYRMFFSMLFLLPVLIKKHRLEIKSLARSTITLCGLSGVLLALHFICYFEAVKFAGIASATVLVDTEVILVAAMMFFFWQEKIPRLGVIGIVLTLIGSVVVAVGDTGAGADAVYGDFLALLGAVMVAGYTIIGRLQRRSVSTVVYTFIVYFTSFLTLSVIMVLTGVSIVGYGKDNIAIGFGLAVVCTMLGHSIFSWGLKYLKASFISTAKLGEPVIATVLGAFIFGQIPGIQQIVGGAVIIGGIYLYIFVTRK